MITRLARAGLSERRADNINAAGRIVPLDEIQRRLGEEPKAPIERKD